MEQQIYKIFYNELKKLLKNSDIEKFYSSNSLEKSKEIGFNLSELAVKIENYDFLKYLVENKYYISGFTNELLVKSKNLEMINYFIEKKIMYDTFPCELEASNGNLEGLKFFIENGYTLDFMVYKEAKKNDHKEIIEYLNTIFLLPKK